MTPDDALMRLDARKLYPPFLERLERGLEALAKQGVDYVATLGYRTFVEQARLYFQGRTMPGNIVTDAPAGLSPHNYGLAVDVCRLVGITPSWTPSDYHIFGLAMERAGLEWGGRWQHPDWDHCEFPGWGSGSRLERLKRVYQLASTNPLQAAWDYVTANPPDMPISLTTKDA